MLTGISVQEKGTLIEIMCKFVNLGRQGVRNFVSAVNCEFSDVEW